jgi:aminoglycoside phosphotransferase (APT) family kinase protein
MATSLGTSPESIHIYRERPNRSLYYLVGLAPGGASVFAKRAVAPRTVIERTIYEDVLPLLPLSAPRFYGSWLDGPHGWLFVEDVGEDRYSERDPEHLALAARWVATLHVAATQIAAAGSLPRGGPERYLTHLRTGREKIIRNLRLWRFPRDEAELLTALLSLCDAIEARWERVQEASDGAPSTIVHGDFRAKNAYLRRNGGGLSLLPIDWETAGWGPPSPDLTRIDLRAYWSVVRHAWPQVDFDTLESWQRMGCVLEELAAVNWVGETLNSESAAARSSAVEDLEVVLSRMAAATRTARVLE